MCDTCDIARKQPKAKALGTIADALNDRRYRNRDRTCIDKLVGELVGVTPSGQDALDQPTESLPVRR